MLKLKKNKNKEEKIPQKKSSLWKAGVPKGARRSAVVAGSNVVLASVPLALVHVGLVYGKITLPEIAGNDTNMAMWSLGSVALPALLSFIVGLCAALLVLPLKGVKYALWLFGQHQWKILLSYMLTLVVLSALVIACVYISRDLSAVRPDNPGMDFIVLAGYAAYLFPLWMGFREGYRGYRLWGAQTMQDRWEEENRRREIKLRGQAYDKLSEQVKIMSGLNRDVPRGAWGFCLLLQPVWITMGIVLGALTGAPWFAAVWFIFLPAILIAVWAYVVKIHDMKLPNKGKWERLSVRRDEDTIDEWEPSKIGAGAWSKIA